MQLFLFKLNRIFWYGFISLLITILFSLFEYDITEPSFIIWAFGFGLVLGVFEEFIIGNWFRKLSTPSQIIIRIVVINLMVISILIISAIYSKSSGEYGDISLISYIIGSNYFRLIYETLIISMMIIFYFQTQSLIGRKMFSKYLFGKYSTPIEEDRIFMFLDLKDSTTIAEKISNIEFYNLLNDCFYEMSEPTLKTDAEILKYVGDEVIFTWPMKKGMKNNNCIELFLLIQKNINKKADYFKKTYGIIPIFKAGVHGGTCTCAQVGHIKKGIDYSGDTVNSAARIQSKCNDLNSHFLISDDLFNSLESTDKYSSTKIDNVILKGKQSVINLISIEK